MQGNNHPHVGISPIPASHETDTAPTSEPYTLSIKQYEGIDLRGECHRSENGKTTASAPRGSVTSAG